MNPELPTAVVVIADVSGVSNVVIAVRFNALLVDISSTVVDVDSVPFEVVGCEETGLVSVTFSCEDFTVSMRRTLLVEISDGVVDDGFVHVEVFGCVETGFVSVTVTSDDVRVSVRR